MAFEITCRGHTVSLAIYHVYKDIWETEISSELPCLPEPGNLEDCYAVVILWLF